MGEDHVVVVRRLKPRPVIYFRAMPRTAREPTENQLRVRTAFAEAARKVRGVRYRERRAGIPPAAEEVARELGGRSFGRTWRPPKWFEVIKELAESRSVSFKRPEKELETVRK